MAEFVEAVVSDTAFRTRCSEIAWYVDAIEPGDEFQALDMKEGKILGNAKVVNVTDMDGHLRTIHFDRPVHGLREFFGDGESQSGAALPFGRLARALAEAFENRFLLAFRNSSAGVDHGKDQLDFCFGADLGTSLPATLFHQGGKHPTCC